MPKYLVGVYYTTMIPMEIEADNEKEAEDKAVAIEVPHDDFIRQLENITFADVEVLEAIGP